MLVHRQKDTVTKRDRVRMALREKYLSSIITVSLSTAIRYVPLQTQNTETAGTHWN